MEQKKQNIYQLLFLITVIYLLNNGLLIFGGQENYIHWKANRSFGLLIPQNRILHYFAQLVGIENVSVGERKIGIKVSDNIKKIPQHKIISFEFIRIRRTNPITNLDMFGVEGFGDRGIYSSTHSNGSGFAIKTENSIAERGIPKSLLRVSLNFANSLHFFGYDGIGDPLQAGFINSCNCGFNVFNHSIDRVRNGKGFAVKRQQIRRAYEVESMLKRNIFMFCKMMSFAHILFTPPCIRNHAKSIDASIKKNKCPTADSLSRRIMIEEYKSKYKYIKILDSGSRSYTQTPYGRMMDVFGIFIWVSNDGKHWINPLEK